MLYRGLLGDAYSGSIANITASHCRGARYFRNRVVPINPNTDRQQLTRIAMSGVSEDWQSLGPEYWSAWAAFASNVRRSNALGESSNRTGFNEYVRWASARTFANAVLGIALPLFPAVPLPLQCEIDFQINTAVQSANTEFYASIDSDAPWWNEPDNALLFWIGSNRGAPEPPTNTIMLPTHHYYRGPWMLVGAILSQDTSNLTVTLANPLLTNQKVPWKARLTTRYRGMSGEVGGHEVAP